MKRKESTPKHIADIACQGRTLEHGYQLGFEHGVALERARIASTRSRAPQWVQMGESTWMTVFRDVPYRAWMRPLESGPDGGQITVTEIGGERVIIDAPSWEFASKAVVSHASKS